MFKSDHSHILREHALEYPSQHIFFLNFLKGGNNVKKNKNRACNTAHRHGELLPITYFGAQLSGNYYLDRLTADVYEGNVTYDVFNYINYINYDAIFIFNNVPNHEKMQ